MDTSLKTITRTDQIFQIMRLMQDNPKMTQEMACKEVGISVSTYKRWLSECEDVIVEFQEEMRQVERNELALIVSAQGHVMNKLIRDALSDNTFASDRLSIKQYMDRRQAEIGDAMRSTLGAHDNDEFNGPKRITGSSSLSVSQNEDGSVTVKPNSPIIIDGELRESK